MQRSFAVLALPFLLFGLTAAHKESNREAEGLLGPVRSESSQLLRLSSGESEKKGRPQQQDLVSYDAQGNEVERTIYDDYGFLRGRQVSKRDRNGHLLERIMSDTDGAVMERQVYVYSDGKLTETIHHDAKGAVELREVNRYDENGRLSEVAYYEGQKKVAKTVYRYDEAGQGSEAVFYMADGSKAIAPIGPCLGAHRMTYSYDSKGRSHKVVAYEPDGTMQKSWLYAYNDKGLMSEVKLEDEYSHTTQVHTYEYDSRGNWTKRISTIDDQRKPREPDELSRLVSSLDGDDAAFTGSYRSRMIISRKIVYY